MEKNADPHVQREAQPADDRQPLYRRRFFGKGLRLLRENYGTRMTASDPTAPTIRARISTAALVECMGRAGYPIGVAAFNEIENGISAPRDAREFLTAIRTCLRLTTDEVSDLELRLASDLLYARFGDRADVFFPPKPEWMESAE
jgi:hypothetical protein